MRESRQAVAGALLATALIVAIACTTDGPTTNTPPTTTTPVAEATPAPTPVPAATPTPAPTGNGRECSLSGATLTLKNTDPIAHSYFGWSTDFDQATTNKDGGGVRKSGDTYEYTDPVGKCRQLDIAHDYNGTALCHAFLDKNGKEFVPSRSPEKVTECRTTPCNPTWRRSEQYEVVYGPWTLPAISAATVQECGTRTVTWRYTETNSCTLETRKVDVSQRDETKSCPTCADLNPNKGAVTKSIEPKVITTHPGTPESAYFYYDVDTDGSNATGKTRCENAGGFWLGDDYNIPNDSSGQNYDDVCRTTSSVSNGKLAFIKKVVVTEATANKYSLSVTANYSIAAGAAQTVTFKIVYNGSTVKKSITVSVACGEAKSGSFTWGPGDPQNSSPNYSAGDGHLTGTYTVTN